MRGILHFVQSLLSEGERESWVDYTCGWNDALAEVIEYIEDRMWEEGEDDGTE
jgi:hypothetical protein